MRLGCWATVRCEMKSRIGTPAPNLCDRRARSASPEGSDRAHSRPSGSDHCIGAGGRDLPMAEYAFEVSFPGRAEVNASRASRMDFRDALDECERFRAGDPKISKRRQ